LLPYSTRINILFQISYELSSLFLEIEHNWHHVSNGDLKESEINDLLFSLKSKSDDIIKRIMANNFLPTKKKFREKADKALDEFLNANYRETTNE
jgi:hypothetical protein